MPSSHLLKIQKKPAANMLTTHRTKQTKVPHVVNKLHAASNTSVGSSDPSGDSKAFHELRSTVSRSLLYYIYRFL